MAKIDLSENEYMERFVGQDHIDSNDNQFWYQLLSCSFNFMRVQDPKIVDKILDPYLVRLTLNNSQSLNIGSLVRVFLDRVSKVKSLSGQSASPYYVFQSFNALYLLRTICKSYIESLSEEQLIKALRAKVDVVQVSQTPLSPPVSPGQHVPQTPTTPEMPNVREIPESNGTLEDVNHNTMLEANKKADITSGSSMLDQYISALIAVIVDIPLSNSTYLLQVESINALLVLLSIQMYSTISANQSTIYNCLMQKKCSIHALILTKTLLNNFIRQQPIPQESGSIIIGLASGLWKVLTLGYGGQEVEDSETMPLLAKQSLLLLNILTNHYTTEKNPYRESIISCQDSRFNLSDPQNALDNANNDALATATTSKSVLMSNSFKVEFHELYETICKYLHDDQVALLLYILLHSNKIFRPYILTTASSSLDKLLIPLLRILYSSIEKGSHHVYMVLIIFIILSEEVSFNEAIHKINVRFVSWYKDRSLSEISLGSLTALIIIRSFQYNTLRIKDKFLHANLFATLANLSNHFKNLHPYVCQRMVELLERLSKRYMGGKKPFQNDNSNQNNKTLDLLNESNPLAKALATDTYKQDLQDASSIELVSTTNNKHTPHAGTAIDINISEQQVSSTNDNLVLPPIDMHCQDYPTDHVASKHSPNSESVASHTNICMEDVRQDDGLVEEVIRMLLEVINNILGAKLTSNPDLIYTLLYKRSVFSNLLSSHQSFYDMAINVERILTYFYNQIEAFERSLSVAEVKDLIQRASNECKFDQNRDPNARLLFHYEEDDQPEEFFIPYIWTRIYYSSGIAWNFKRIVLFSPVDL